MPRDDEDDDRPRRPRKKAGASTLVKVIVGAGAVLALGVGGCTLIVGLEFYQGVKERSKARSELNAATTAETFLEHIQEGRPDAAYAATTDHFRVTMDRAQFGEFIAAHPILIDHTFHNPKMLLPDGPVPGKGFVAYFNLLFSGEPTDEQKKDPKFVTEAEVAVTMSAEGGVWRVDAISVKRLR
jgi:hypothetical protein